MSRIYLGKLKTKTVVGVDMAIVRDLFDGLYGNIQDAVSARKYYTKLVEVLRISNSGEHYFNRYPWQVRVVYDNLMTYAEKTVNNRQPCLCMFFGDVDFYFLQEDIDKRLSALADKGCEIKILLTNPPSKKSLYRWEELTNKGNVTVKNMSVYRDNLYHLWVYDDAFRVEDPHPQLKPNMKITDISPERRAEFAFHDKRNADVVREYFNKQYDDATAL